MGNKKLIISLLALAVMQGCSNTNRDQSATDSNDTEKVFIQDDVQLVLREDATNQLVYSAATEIEAVASDDSMVVWNEDGDSSLKFANINALKTSHKAQSFAVSHDVDQLCIAPLTGNVHDLYAHDGDEYFYHYWLHEDTQQLKLIRKIATNPDVINCHITDDKLVFSDSYLGELSLDREVEKDIVLKPYRLTDTNQPVSQKRTVAPAIETEAVADHGDAADDPAIITTEKTVWIIGTNKKRGLAVYDLSGEEIHFIPRGRLNNVDVVEMANNDYLVSASNRTEKTIDLYWAKPDQSTIEFIDAIPLSLDDPYGLCMNKNSQGVQVIVGDSDSKLDYWLIDHDFSTKDVNKSARLMKQFEFSSQTEGCDVDADTNTLYVGEENKGIWKIDLNTYDMALIEKTGDKNLVADVEGMDIYEADNNKYLVASSQGSDSFVVYQLNPWQEVADFKIAPNFEANIDGVSETDGLAVSSTAIPGFPQGMLVVQDGRNLAPKQNQNFKVIDWREVSELIKH